MTLSDAASWTLPTVSTYLQSSIRASGPAITLFQVIDLDLHKDEHAHTGAQCGRLRAGGVLWPGRQVNSFLADLTHGWFACRLVEKRKPGDALRILPHGRARAGFLFSSGGQNLQQAQGARQACFTAVIPRSTVEECWLGPYPFAYREHDDSIRASRAGRIRSDKIMSKGPRASRPRCPNRSRDISASRVA